MKPRLFLLPAGRRARPVRSGLFKGIRLALDLHGGDLQMYAGLYERETFPWLRRLLRGCQGAIDVGAAKGELSLLCLRQPGMRRVVAVEPAKTECALLQANLALNHLTGDPRFWLHLGFAGRGSPPRWRTLDELAAEVPAPLFIKIDVDGPEAEVLATGSETLFRRDCRLLIETHSVTAETVCQRQLLASGYVIQIIPNAWWRRFIPERRTIPHNRWLAAWRAANPPAANP